MAAGGDGVQKSIFIKNTAILTATSLLLRTIGIFFRVYMSNKIGAEGMGLYQLIFSIYILASTFASSGICTAVTRMVTDELVCGSKRSVLRILRRAVGLSVLIGGLSLLLILFGADWIGQIWLKDARAIPALRVMAFSLPFMGVSSCLRGYFLARRKVASTSRAQILEQLVRIGLIMLLIDRFSARGVTAACVAVMIGDSLAEAASCLYLAIGYWLDRRRLPAAASSRAPYTGILRKLLSIAVPITAGRYLNTLLRTIENILVPDCLTKYTDSRETSLSQFGMLKGMAMPLLFFPSAFLSAFSTLLIPEISEANALKKEKTVERAVNRTLHLTFALSILISGVFTAFARPLGLLLYNSAEVGFYLQVLAPLMPIMYVESVVDGILKGLNQQASSLRYSVIDSVLRIGLIFVLVPVQGMQGFLLIMVISNILTSFLNLHRLLKVTRLHMQWSSWLIKPLLAIATACAFSRLICRLPWLSGLPPLASLLIGGAVIGGVYLVLMGLFGCELRPAARTIPREPTTLPPTTYPYA